MVGGHLADRRGVADGGHSAGSRVRGQSTVQGQFYITPSTLTPTHSQTPHPSLTPPLTPTLQLESLKPEVQELGKELAGEVAMAQRQYNWSERRAKASFKRNVSQGRYITLARGLQKGCLRVTWGLCGGYAGVN